MTTRAFAYYTRVNVPAYGGLGKKCECGYTCVWVRLKCPSCHKTLRKRPRKKKDRSIDKRIEANAALLDQWLTKLTLAATKIRYYRNRERALERERTRGPVVRPKRKPPTPRAIRLREEVPR